MFQNNKVAGWHEITGSMLKHGGKNLVTRLTKLLNNCWKEQVVPMEWHQEVILKLPKKRYPSDCNNWNGITLLSVP